MSPPTYAPSAGRTVAGARVHGDAELGRGDVGQHAGDRMNGATPSGSGSIPSASSTIVALPASAIS